MWTPRRRGAAERATREEPLARAETRVAEERTRIPDTIAERATATRAEGKVATRDGGRSAMMAGPKKLEPFLCGRWWA